MGWVQEWEPNARRAFWVEVATGNSQWEQPLGDSSRDMGPPGGPPPIMSPPPSGPISPPPGGYYGGPPPQEGGYYPPPQGETEEERKKSDRKKMLMGAMGGLAVGGIAGAVLNHEFGMFTFYHIPSRQRNISETKTNTKQVATAAPILRRKKKKKEKKSSTRSWSSTFTTTTMSLLRSALIPLRWMIGSGAVLDDELAFFFFSPFDISRMGPLH